MTPPIWKVTEWVINSLEPVSEKWNQEKYHMEKVENTERAQRRMTWCDEYILTHCVHELPWKAIIMMLHDNSTFQWKKWGNLKISYYIIVSDVKKCQFLGMSDNNWNLWWVIVFFSGGWEVVGNLHELPRDSYQERCKAILCIPF